MLIKNNSFSLKLLYWTKYTRNKLSCLYCEIVLELLNTQLIEKRYELNKDINLRIYSERSRFAIKSTAASLTERFHQNSCHDSLKWGQSYNVFFFAGTDTGLFNSLEIISKTFNELSLEKLRTVELLLCVWCFPTHSFTSLVKFDWLDILKFRLACGAFCLWYTTRDFEKVVISHGYWLSAIFTMSTKSWKSSRRFFSRISCSTRWWKLFADINVCPGPKYLRVIVCVAVFFRFFTSLANAVKRNQFLFWATQFRPRK